MATEPTKHFPKVLYAYSNPKSPDLWLWEKIIDGIDSGTLIGTYELKEVGKIVKETRYEKLEQEK